MHKYDDASLPRRAAWTEGRLKPSTSACVKSGNSMHRDIGSAHYALLTVSVLLLAVRTVWAETPSQNSADNLRSMLSNSCFECHGPDTQEGKLNFDELLTHEPLVRDRETWRRAIQLLEMGVMPPEYATAPLTDDERQAILKELDRTITRFDYSTIDDPGFVPMRRLSHGEYNNTIRDLLGVDLKPADRFPSELIGATGFDNSANTLSMQPALMERYIGAAERVIDLALPPEPLTEAHRITHAMVFVAKPDETTSEQEAADKVLRRFLRRAYRRPPTDDEVRAIAVKYDAARAGGLSFEAAIKHVLPSVLISPKFLLRIEAGSDDNNAHRISDWELASRLSYFIWASMPDDELFDLAEQGKLHNSKILAAQVDRMLVDPKADSLGESFAAQWLNTQLIGTRIRLDPIDNPWCTDSLMSAMRHETSLFFMSLLRENRSIDELIQSDYTFMNEELASTLYHKKGVEGAHMRRVSLDDANRGGILGQPAVLTVTASHKDTSPVKRGIFVLDTILGTPPPPPPPDAGKLDKEIEKNNRLTFREKLAKHASDATCQACHATMDPVGAAMENFDYFGRWRETYRGTKPVDAVGTLPDGTALSGPTGLKKWILEKRHNELVRHVASKLLAYALGRQLEYYDEPAIQKIVERLEKDDYRFQTLLNEIVRSYPFQYRKNPFEDSST
jgi:uncharacterized protein DUF1592/uncharacterized protein DUF1588/uncharacterized protein DUF1587/uncharacterized protein DUF1585/uncharacterized protein DUF1595/cytochrome c